MEITEVRIKLMEEAGERLQAFCSITFDDCFVVRDLKIIEGTNGPFVAMPSRRLTSHCGQCGCKNHLRAAYCNQCGMKLKDDRVAKDDDGRAKLYADIAHPINSACREMIQESVIRAYHDEIVKARQPGYVSTYDDFDVESDAPPRRSAHPPAPHMQPKVSRLPVQQAKHEPANQQPRGPHKRPQREAAPARQEENQFGAGVFE